MRNKVRKVIIFASFLFLAVSCVTVNIYFPAAAVEKAADKIVEEVWGENIQESDKKEEPQSFLDPLKKLSRIKLGIKEAYAQEANVNVTTPAIRALKGSMKKKAASIRPFLDKGNVGITNTGTLMIRSNQGLNLKDKAMLSRLVKAENKDREALYREIAKANKYDSDKISDIRTIFAGSWIRNAQKGWWVQDPKGNWAKK